VAGLVLMAWSRPNGGQASVVSSQWARWALAAWMLAGIANAALLLSSQYAPDDPLAFLICGTIEGGVLLGVRRLCAGRVSPPESNVPSVE